MIAWGFEIEVQDGFMKTRERPKPIAVETGKCDARRELIATGCSRASSHSRGRRWWFRSSQHQRLISEPRGDIRLKSGE